MPQVHTARALAFTPAASERDSATVAAVVASVATALRLPVEERPLAADLPEASARVLTAMQDRSVQLAALPHSSGHVTRLVMEVIQRCVTPVLLVPLGRRAETPRPLARILVPLDGTVESAQTVAETVEMFAASGADIVVLHVFGEQVPRFWDQPVHARKSWAEEFLARYCTQPNARVELRVGNPGDHILDVAAKEHVDLITLGWSQNLSPGRARTVRATIAQARIPILLLPVPVIDATHGITTTRAPTPG